MVLSCLLTRDDHVYGILKIRLVHSYAGCLFVLLVGAGFYEALSQCKERYCRGEVAAAA